jgi:hypothetical protein
VFAKSSKRGGRFGYTPSPFMAKKLAAGDIARQDQKQLILLL